MAASSWRVYNSHKSDLLNAAQDVVGKALKIEIVTASYVEDLTNTLFTTGDITTAAAQVSNASSDTYTFASGAAQLIATGNHQRLDIASSAVFNAVGGTMDPGFAILGTATDNQLIAYCDLNTGTTAGLSITSGNSLTISFPTSGVYLFNSAT